MKITHIEIKFASNGNEYKQVTIAEKMFGDKDRINVFSNHGKYNSCTVDADIPENLLYINDRGYLELKDEQAKPKASAVTEMALKTHITQCFDALKADLKVIADHLEVKAPTPKVGNTNVDYPTDESEGIDTEQPPF